MSKLIKYRKEFTPRPGENIWDILWELQDTDFLPYLKHMAGTKVVINIESAEITAEKMRMYAYYQKVVLSVAMVCFTDMGWEGIDKNRADEMLKDECAQEPIFNKSGEKRLIREDKKHMTKDRLIKYINDCILFLEENGYRVPESEEYKNRMITGIAGFKTLK